MWLHQSFLADKLFCLSVDMCWVYAVDQDQVYMIWALWDSLLFNIPLELLNVHKSDVYSKHR